jgi:hypothetical protein
VAIYLTTADGTRRRFTALGMEEADTLYALRHSHEEWLTIQDADGSTTYLRMSQVVSIEHQPDPFDPNA